MNQSSNRKGTRNWTYVTQTTIHHFMYDNSDSDGETVHGLMDVEFPFFDESHEENDADESDVSVPVVDISSGWDNNAVDRCLNLALASYNSIGRDEDFEPRINVNLASDGKSLMYLDSDKTAEKGSIASQESVHIQNQRASETVSPQSESIFSNWIPKSL
jgi:hypothetical protein